MKLPQTLDRLLREHRVRIMDVGARGGWPGKWRPLRPWTTLVGVEPEKKEWERLQNTAAENEIYLPHALDRCSGERTLHHTRDPHCSSLYPPNRRLIQRLRPGDDQLDVLRTESIRVRTLDDALAAAGLSAVDFIKVDTQGSELDILEGSVRALESGVIGVEVEVEFLPLYEGQPLFSDVHQFLAARGFELMDFPNTCSVADFRAASAGRHSKWPLARWLISRFQLQGTYRGAKQLLYADAVYLLGMESLLDWLRQEPEERDLRAARAVVVCCANSHYDHAQALVTAAYGQNLLDESLHRDLLTVIRTLSTAAPEMLRDLRRLVRRARHRFRHAGG